jgi:hypothetical protein
MPSIFDVWELARKLFASDSNLDSYALWHATVDEIPEMDLRDVLHSFVSDASKRLRDNCMYVPLDEGDHQALVTGVRDAAPPPLSTLDPRSRIDPLPRRGPASIATLVEHLLQEPVAIGNSRIEKLFGDCTRDDVLQIASTSRGQERAMKIKAERHERLASIMGKNQLTRDLPPGTLVEVMGI